MGMFNKTVTCKACKNQIAKTAKRCPYCGARQHQVALTFAYLIVVFAFVAVFWIIGDSLQGGSEATTAPLSSGSLTEDAIKVDYKTLYKDYSDNPINADKTYKDKLLSLTGTIANIDRDIGKNPYITFNVDEYGAQSIKMSFDSDDTVAALKKGQTVTVVGTCDGTFASTIVVLSKCEIVK